MTTEELTVEFSSLKRQLWWTQRIAFGVFFLGAFLLFGPFGTGFGTLNVRTVRAQRFEAVDSSGRQRAFIQVGDAQPQFHILNGKGGSGLSLYCAEDQTRLNIYSGSSQLGFILGGLSGWTAQMNVSDNRTHSDTWVNFAPDAPPVVSFSKGKETPTVVFPAPR